jgi:subtilisin family serine protease
MREYIVSLKKDIDYQQFWDQIENESQEDGFVPSRRVEIFNNRDGSLRSCHYLLTDEEAQILKNDPRVYSVEIPPQQRDDIQIGLTTSQTGNFTKTSSSSGNHINWGLIRNSNATNVYGTGTTTALTYDYLADGTGVDVVIHDSGLQIDHPEFQDASGNSRVQTINWYTASGLSGTQSSNHYQDVDGHGTHVAGIAAGKTYGWAKNAKIFSVKVSGLETGSGTDGTGISLTDCFDVVKLWHRNKPIDSTIGRKRPTIVNMSWGYSAGYGNITGGSYRGTPWSGFSADASKGMISSRRSPVRVGSIDVDLEELIDEGVIVCIAAGNDTHKIDVVGGVDYNNYWTSSLYGNTYYHRGSSPYSSKAIMVGSMDSTPYSASVDQKSSFSNAGPGVDIFAAGSNIQSTTSNNNRYGGVPYTLNSSYKQLNISGTSMASPQMTGIGALFLQNNLTATPAQYKTWLQTNATSTIYSTGLDNDYTNTISQYGGTSKVAYSFTAAGSDAYSGIAVWTGSGGRASATFKRIPPRVLPVFENYGFERGIFGWRVVSNRVKLNGGSILAGWPTPTDPTPTPVSPSGTSPGDTSVGFTGSFSYTLETADLPPSGETKCLRLSQNPGTIDYSGNILYGPALYSDFAVPFSVGDSIVVSWKALAGGDAYNIYSYLVNQDTGACIQILDQTGANDTASTSWTTVTRTITSGQEGNYHLVFVAGSFDYTFGRYIGGEFLVDNIQINKA